ncbi:MAG: phosphoglucosamine mutase [Gammaproteobacteria bacterium]
MDKIKKYFGTDGIRGRVGEYPITADFVLKLGWAVGRVLAKHGSSKVLIGKDTRISGYMFESALEAGLSAAGVDIHLLGPMPTPAIAYLTRTLRANVGIVISASHNLYEDNGIKFFSAEGMKLPDEVENAIEEYLMLEMKTVPSIELGKAVRVVDARGRYIEFCKSTVPAHTSLKNLKIVVDCAHGATYAVAPHVFRELGAEVIEMNVKPNGLNINADCGSTDPENLQKKVVAEKADLGIALDGDGDRVMMVDHQGEIVNGDELLYIIVRDRYANHQLKGGVVGTLMSNFGLERSLKALGIDFIRTKVGDRYVLAELEAHDWDLGGESSGHIICRYATTTGDGVISALQVLLAMLHSGKSLHDLKQELKTYPQILINVKVNNENAKNLVNDARVNEAVQEVENKLSGYGRVLIRSSGTEPLIRVMVEGEDEKIITKHANYLAEIITKLAS